MGSIVNRGISALAATVAFGLMACCTPGCSRPDQPVELPPGLLIFTKTAGFRHSSIPAGVAMFERIASSAGYKILHTEDAAVFHPDTLRQFEVIVFLSTTGNILDAGQQEAMETFMAAGGSFLGVHAAADTEYDWPWYGQMLGARFSSHPDIQQADVILQDTVHPAVMGLPARWQRRDEWYNFRDLVPGLSTLLTVDENTYEGGTHGEFHPVSWCREFGGGRVFYTAMGHTEDSFEEPAFEAHLAGAVRWLLAR